MTADVVPLSRGRKLPFERGDHVEIAARLVASLRATGEVVHDDGITWRYNEATHVFEAVAPAQLSRVVQAFAGATIKADSKPLRLRAADVSGSIKLAEDLLTKPQFFIGAPAGVVFSSSFVEVTRTGIFEREHSPNHRARFAYDFSFQAAPNPARLLEFLGQAFAPDSDASDKIRLVQEFVGIALLGLSTRYQRALTKVGAGANGKGVLAAVIESAMPRGSCVAIAPQDFGNEYRAAMLAGKLLNIVSELPEADILDSEAFKAVVAGDSRTARHIRQAPFTFRPVAGHLFAANRLPGTVDHTHGFWRRILVLQFNRVFDESEQDPELAKRIVEAELPAIVSWFLVGAHRVLASGGYTVPESSAKAVSDWRRSADQIRAFVDECTKPLPVDVDVRLGARARDLYRAYQTWARENGERAMANNKFAERMGQLKLRSQHTMVGSFYPVTLEYSAR